MTNVLGLEVKGEITPGHKAVPQRSQEEFVEILERALSHDEVAGFTWTQYTPYFNDGDPCVFSASPYCYGYDEEDEGEGEYFIILKNGQKLDSYSFVAGDGTYPLGKLIVERDYVDGKRGEVSRKYEDTDNTQRLDDLREFSKAIEGGAFDNVLLQLFGDHARVKLLKDDGIYVEFYDHD